VETVTFSRDIRAELEQVKLQREKEEREKDSNVTSKQIMEDEPSYHVETVTFSRDIRAELEQVKLQREKEQLEKEQLEKEEREKEAKEKEEDETMIKSKCLARMSTEPFMEHEISIRNRKVPPPPKILRRPVSRSQLKEPNRVERIILTDGDEGKLSTVVIKPDNNSGEDKLNRVERIILTDEDEGKYDTVVIKSDIEINNVDTKFNDNKPNNRKVPPPPRRLSRPPINRNQLRESNVIKEEVTNDVEEDNKSDTFLIKTDDVTNNIEEDKSDTFLIKPNTKDIFVIEPNTNNIPDPDTYVIKTNTDLLKLRNQIKHNSSLENELVSTETIKVNDNDSNKDNSVFIPDNNDDELSLYHVETVPLTNEEIQEIREKVNYNRQNSNCNTFPLNSPSNYRNGSRNSLPTNNSRSFIDKDNVLYPERSPNKLPKPNINPSGLPNKLPKLNININPSESRDSIDIKTVKITKNPVIQVESEVIPIKYKKNDVSSESEIDNLTQFRQNLGIARAKTPEEEQISQQKLEIMFGEPITINKIKRNCKTKIDNTVSNIKFKNREVNVKKIIFEYKLININTDKYKFLIFQNELNEYYFGLFPSQMNNIQDNIINIPINEVTNYRNGLNANKYNSNNKNIITRVTNIDHFNKFLEEVLESCEIHKRKLIEEFVEKRITLIPYRYEFQNPIKGTSITINMKINNKKIYYVFNIFDKHNSVSITMTDTYLITFLKLYIKQIKKMKKKPNKK